MPDPFDIGDLERRADDEIAALLAAHPDIAAERFADEELLIRGGAATEDIFLLLQGSCVVETVDAPEERRAGDALAVLDASPEAPVFVGEMAYLSQRPRSAGVRSVMATYALRLRPAHLDAIIDDFPGLTRILCRQFTQRLRETNAQFQALRARMALHPEQLIVESGQVVCEAGAPAEMLYQLVDGTLMYDGSEDKIRSEPGTPCFIEARAFFTCGAYCATCRAKGLAIVLAHPAASRAAIVRNYPDAVLDLLCE